MPSSFVAAITNGSFTADGPLTGTGLTEAVGAIRLKTNAPTTTPDYVGSRSGAVTFAAYKAQVADVANWTVDTTNGAYATTVPNTTAFTITPVPQPAGLALLVAGGSAILACAGVAAPEPESRPQRMKGPLSWPLSRS